MKKLLIVSVCALVIMTGCNIFEEVNKVGEDIQQSVSNVKNKTDETVKTVEDTKAKIEETLDDLDNAKKEIKEAASAIKEVVK